MNCKDLTNCHPNDNRKGEKSSKISIKLCPIQLLTGGTQHHQTQPKSSLSSIYAKFGVNFLILRNKDFNYAFLGDFRGKVL
jgi:hypothetical protein